MSIKPRQLKVYTTHNLDKIPQLGYLPFDTGFELEVVSKVLPFKVNNYVLEELIDWNDVPDDPIYNLTFLQKGMLRAEDFAIIADAIKRDASTVEIQALANKMRDRLNPHPAGQMTANVPEFESGVVEGIQHKYPETCLVFPSHGQTCHSYCSFCFRWAQFVGRDDWKFATDETRRFQDYLRSHKEITDALFTGGDPMTMSANILKTYIQPLLSPEFEHIQTIRIGTKSLAYWPYRYVTDRDSDDILRLFEQVVSAGKHLAIMAHYNHWKELSTPIAQEAIRRLRATGALIRTQSPLIRYVNDDPQVWIRLWKEQIRLGCIPYYMFIERNTGANHFFSIPLYRAWQIFQEAFQQISGLGRTVRGPSMSAYPGKVAIEGVAQVGGEKVFVLTFLQARNPDWCKRPFFAKFDLEATWLEQLKPAFEEKKFFFEQELLLAQASSHIKV
jgi:KamA family protein